ncbi:MAG TPA: MBL fold metallo-hydrolase [Bacillota bacterium]|nr:MBL fold metallo-hydrolase [Bacillota bacterium]
MTQEIMEIDLKGVNCYLGKEGNSFILFDTGGHLTLDKTYTDRCKALRAELERLGCKPGNLKLIVLTHGDCDHVANAARIREEYQTKIAMHAGDLPLVENLTIEKMMRSFHYRSLVLNVVFQIMKRPIKKLSHKVLNDFQPFKPDILVNEGDSLVEWGLDAKVLHIPGHTEGSIGVLTGNGDLIAGDIFNNVKKPGIALNGDDFKMLAQSVDRLKAMNIHTVYPGHGLPFQMSDLK